MRTTRKGKSIFLRIPTLILWIMAISILISSEAYASKFQDHSANPEVIFAASCATCHGANGLGGVTFVKNSPQDKRIAPRLAGKNPGRIIKRVRHGTLNSAMPAFGPEEITNAELKALALWLNKYKGPGGIPPGDRASAPTGLTCPSGTACTTEVRLDILDADPWFQDDGTDDYPADGRRVDLAAGDYLKVVNTGRTWHTFTNSAVGRDSGFIGYAGNYRNTVGDLDAGTGKGYYYADQTTGLADNCVRYLCKMHPYMQVEVCTGAGSPAPLTRSSKMPMAVPPVLGATGSEVWVTTQSQEDSGEDTVETVGGRGDGSVDDFDGTYQAILADTAGWPVDDGSDADLDEIINNVGNNPHNSWPGRDNTGEVVMGTSWHDNTVYLMDAVGKTLIRNNIRSGTTNAHMMTRPDGDPNNSDRFFTTHMGGNDIQELSVNRMRAGYPPKPYRLNPNITGRLIPGYKGAATGPHGLWFCDDGVHILTADTFGGSATLYNINTKKFSTAPSGGVAPLAPAIIGGHGGGCAKGFTNNAITADVSIYDITGDTITHVVMPPTDVAAPGLDYDPIAGGSNGAGNIALKDTTNLCLPPAGLGNLGYGGFLANGGTCADPVRWALLPIQTPVSPADATTHGRFIVTANKASHNVSITALDDGGNACGINGCDGSVTNNGRPLALFTIPAGLGAHGVTYGPKANCDTNNDGSETIDDPDAPGTKCYYAYVTNTFEGGENSSGANAGYISVYDLEKIDVDDDGNYTDNPAGAMGAPGSAFTILATSSGLVGAGAGTAITSLAFPTTIGPVVGSGGAFVCIDLTGGVGGLMDTNSEMARVEGYGAGAVIANLVALGPDLGQVKVGSLACPGGLVEIDLGAIPNPNGIADVVEIAVLAGLVSGADSGVVAPVTCIVGGVGNGTADLVEGALLGCLTAGGNAGDTDGDGLGPDLLAPINALCPDCRAGVHVGDVPLDDTGIGAADPTQYTYVKDEVWVDDVNPFVVTVIAGPLAGTTVGIGGTVDAALLLDLDLQIRTGGQGIVHRPAASPWP